MVQCESNLAMDTHNCAEPFKHDDSMDTNTAQTATANIDTDKITLPVITPTLHGVTKQNTSSLGNDSRHGSPSVNEMLPVITGPLLGGTNSLMIPQTMLISDSMKTSMYHRFMIMPLLRMR